MYLIYSEGSFIGTTLNASTPMGQSVPAPLEFNIDYISFYFLENGAAVLDEAKLIDHLKTAAVLRIKAAAFEKIAALDWKLDRAREREDASWESLEVVNAVLAMRESIRRSSDEAETAVMSLMDISEIESFAWEVTVNVPAPRRVTRQQFLDRLTPEETASIIEAAQASSSIAAWILRLENAAFINLDDPACLMAMESLEIAGLIASGRAQEIIA